MRSCIVHFLFCPLLNSTDLCVLCPSMFACVRGCMPMSERKKVSLSWKTLPRWLGWKKNYARVAALLRPSSVSSGLDHTQPPQSQKSLSLSLSVYLQARVCGSGQGADISAPHVILCYQNTVHSIQSWSDARSGKRQGVTTSRETAFLAIDNMWIREMLIVASFFVVRVLETWKNRLKKLQRGGHCRLGDKE